MFTPLWTGQPLAYPAVQKSGAAAEVFDLLEAAGSLVGNDEPAALTDEEIGFDPAGKRVKKSKIKVKIAPKSKSGNTRKCGNCAQVGHQARKCPKPIAAGKTPLGNGFVNRKRAGSAPIDIHQFTLIKERKAEFESATEIAERYDLDHDVVADAMIAPDWIAYSSRYEKV